MRFPMSFWQYLFEDYFFNPATRFDEDLVKLDYKLSRKEFWDSDQTFAIADAMDYFNKQSKKRKILLLQAYKERLIRHIGMFESTLRRTDASILIEEESKAKKGRKKCIKRKKPSVALQKTRKKTKNSSK